jgi:uncharacterized membrane protein
MNLLGREAHMAANDNKPIELSWRIFGLGIIALGVVGLVWGDFVSSQPVPKWFPERIVLAYVAAAFMLVAGAGIELRRTIAWAAAALTVYYGLIVLLLENTPLIFKNYAVYGAYFGAVESLAITAGALIVYTATADMDAARAARLTRIAQLAFGVCAVFFGGAHFIYMGLTAPLIPKWLPPSQEFWGYATGAFHIAAGVAILTGIQARLGAILAAVMYASFIPLVFVPVLMTEPTSFRWTRGLTEAALTTYSISVQNFVFFYAVSHTAPPPTNNILVIPSEDRSQCARSEGRRSNLLYCLVRLQGRFPSPREAPLRRE